MRGFIRKDTKGDTIISVMVAFVLLMIGISMVTTSIQFAMKMLHISEAARTDSDRAVEQYYREESSQEVTAEDITISFFQEEKEKKEGEKGTAAIQYDGRYQKIKVKPNKKVYEFYSIEKETEASSAAP